MTHTVISDIMCQQMTLCTMRVCTYHCQWPYVPSQRPSWEHDSYIICTSTKDTEIIGVCKDRKDGLCFSQIHLQIQLPLYKIWKLGVENSLQYCVKIKMKMDSMTNERERERMRLP